MSFFEPQARNTPSGPAKLLALNWPLVMLLSAIAATGFVMLYSVAGGVLERWAEPQMIRFGVGMAAMLVMAMINIRFWRAVAPAAYIGALALLVLVEVMGTIGMGAQRWIDLGFILLQPSEVMKIALVMALAWASPIKVTSFPSSARVTASSAPYTRPQITTLCPIAALFLSAWIWSMTP